MDLDNSIEITYTAFGFEEAGETTFEMDVNDRLYDRLQDAEEEGEVLDSDYISEAMPGIHKKILKAIRRNMKEEGYYPDDGMVERRGFLYLPYRVYELNASHEMMHDLAEDDDIEYTVTI